MPVLMIDPQRIRQILFNLVGNAAKFTQSGFVEVRGSFTRAGADAKTGTLRIEVEDTGCGISKGDMKRIASPYVQVRSKLARHGGTGLGLAICRQLAAAMGGRLGVVSELGRGSTFSIEIPGVRPAPAAEREASAASPDSVNPEKKAMAHAIRRILVVDDVKVNAMVLKAHLKNLGDFETAVALDGQEALTALTAPDSQPFDLVLTDMWMPNLDGEGLVRAIRKDPALAPTRVIVVTADVEMRTKAGEMGFDDILLKPVTSAKLAQTLASGAGSMRRP